MDAVSAGDELQSPAASVREPTAFSEIAPDRGLLLENQPPPAGVGAGRAFVIFWASIPEAGRQRREGGSQIG